MLGGVRLKWVATKWTRMYARTRGQSGCRLIRFRYWMKQITTRLSSWLAGLRIGNACATQGGMRFFCLLKFICIQQHVLHTCAAATGDVSLFCMNSVYVRQLPTICLWRSLQISDYWNWIKNVWKLWKPNCNLYGCIYVGEITIKWIWLIDVCPCIKSACSKNDTSNLQLKLTLKLMTHIVLYINSGEITGCWLSNLAAKTPLT